MTFSIVFGGIIGPPVLFLLIHVCRAAAGSWHKGRTAVVSAALLALVFYALAVFPFLFWFLWFWRFLLEEGLGARPYGIPADFFPTGYCLLAGEYLVLLVLWWCGVKMLRVFKEDFPKLPASLILAIALWLSVAAGILGLSERHGDVGNGMILLLPLWVFLLWCITPFVLAGERPGEYQKRYRQTI